MPIAILPWDAANAALYLSRDQSVHQLPAVPDRETDYDAFTSRPDDIEQLKMLGFANINLYGSSDYSQVEFNVHRPALQDKRVRQALIYGLDRQKLIDVVYQGYGKVAIEPIAPISWAFNAEGVNPYPYDPAQAKKLLDEAGWKPGADGIRAKDGQRLELTLLVSKKVLNDALIPIAKENWRQIGVLLKPQVVDFNALMAQRKAGNYDLASFSTSTLNDPHDGVWDFYSSEAKESGYHNAEVDKLINAGNAVLDIEQRKPIYHQLYKVLAEDPPVILLGYREILSASSARVSGFKPDIYNGLTGSLPDVKSSNKSGRRVNRRLMNRHEKFHPEALAANAADAAAGLLHYFFAVCQNPRRLYRWQYHPDLCPRRGAEGDLRPRPAAIDPLPPLAGTVAAR